MKGEGRRPRYLLHCGSFSVGISPRLTDVNPDAHLSMLMMLGEIVGAWKNFAYLSRRARN